MEYDGTKPMNLRPRFSNAFDPDPSFDKPPGSSSGAVRAYWELGKWIFSRDMGRSTVVTMWILFSVVLNWADK